MPAPRPARGPEPPPSAEAERRLARYVRAEVAAFSARYRDAFARAGIDPRRVRGLADLAALPPTRREDLGGPAARDFELRPTLARLREHWGFGRKLGLVLGGRRAWQNLATAWSPVLDLASDSPDGAPLRVATTGSDLERLASDGARDLARAGVAPGWPLVVTGRATGLARWIALLAGMRLGCRVEPAAADPLEALERTAARALWAPAGDALALARAARAAHPRVGALELVVAHGRGLDDTARAEVVDGFAAAGARVRVLGAYVCTAARAVWLEVGSDTSGGFPVPTDRCSIEVVDPVTLAPSAPGASGELLLTPLSGRGTAVLRYRTGDLLPEGLLRAGDRTPPRLPRALERRTPTAENALP